MKFLPSRFENINISNKKLLSMFLLLFCIFISLFLSDIPFIVNMQNQNYYNKIIKEHMTELKYSSVPSSTQPQTHTQIPNPKPQPTPAPTVNNVFSGSSFGIYPSTTAAKQPQIEGMADMSANNIISDIINDSKPSITPFEQLIAIKQIAKMGTYSSTNMKTLMEIIDTSGNSDSTKINNLNRFINTYVSSSSTK